MSPAKLQCSMPQPLWNTTEVHKYMSRISFKVLAEGSDSDRFPNKMFSAEHTRELVCRFERFRFFKQFLWISLMYSTAAQNVILISHALDIIAMSEISDWSNPVPPPSSAKCSCFGAKKFTNCFWKREQIQPRFRDQSERKNHRAAPDSREVIISTQMDLLTKTDRSAPYPAGVSIPSL